LEIAVIALQQDVEKHLIVWDCNPRPAKDEDGKLRRRLNIGLAFKGTL
jgi:hypothetical protein